MHIAWPSLANRRPVRQHPTQPCPKWVPPRNIAQMGATQTIAAFLILAAAGGPVASALLPCCCTKTKSTGASQEPSCCAPKQSSCCQKSVESRSPSRTCHHPSVPGSSKHRGCKCMTAVPPSTAPSAIDSKRVASETQPAFWVLRFRHPTDIAALPLRGVIARPSGPPLLALHCVWLK